MDAHSLDSRFSTEEAHLGGGEPSIAGGSPASLRANGGEPVPQEVEEPEIALELLADDSPLRASCDYVITNPGKRFRAAIVESAAQYGDRAEDPLVRRMAVAIELFHGATLAHDDVVDDGDLRRGKATVGVHSGNLAAGLAGGWLFARAGELIAEAGAGPISRFAEAASIVCEGEMQESRALHDVDRTRDDYLAAIEAKTARLIAFSAWLGAIAGGAEPEVAERLERYGEAVGMAFQIADDILDLVGDPASTGKTEGSDLRGGVYTLPAIHALKMDSGVRDLLLLRPEEHELSGLVERVRDTGAVEIALAECNGWIEQAIEALPCGDPAAGHEQRLLSLARSVATRVEETV
jgi:heptaprenyl diphosphate synthase